MINVLCFLAVFLIVGVFSLAIRHDSQLKRFRNNLKPGQKAQHRFGNEYTQVVIDRILTPGVAHFHLESNPRQRVISNVNMIYPV